MESGEAASADYIFHLDLFGTGADSNTMELCCVTLLLLPSVSWVSCVASFSFLLGRVADYIFHRRDWRSPFPFPTGSSRQVNCDPAWPSWVPEGASILPARGAGI